MSTSTWKSTDFTVEEVLREVESAGLPVHVRFTAMGLHFTIKSGHHGKMFMEDKGEKEPQVTHQKGDTFTTVKGLYPTKNILREMTPEIPAGDLVGNGKIDAVRLKSSYTWILVKNAEFTEDGKVRVTSRLGNISTYKADVLLKYRKKR